MLAMVVAMPIIWWYITAAQAMREGEIPGSYTSDGVWGKSTLLLRSDHTFSQVADFTNEFTGKSEGTKRIDGIWKYNHHSISENQIEFSPFVRLDPVDQQRVDNQFETTYSMMITAPALAVSPGAGIYYFKQRP